MNHQEHAKLIFHLQVSFLLMLVASNSGCMTADGKRIIWPEDAVVYQPSGPHPEDWIPPELEYEDIYFTNQDGQRLHGWYCAVDDPRAVVLFAHGNAGNISYRYPNLLNLTKELQVTVFAFDYRGYGRSEGLPSEDGIIADTRAARAWLADREGIEESEIVLLGRSLGGGVMVDLAAKDGARALILESTFTSLPEVANDTLPGWPGLIMFNRFNSLKKIPEYRGPLLLAHGTEDEIVPFDHSQKLYAAANEPKQLIEIAGAGHNWSATESYLEELGKFFDSLNQ